MKKYILSFVVIFIFFIVFMQSGVNDEDFVEAYENYYGITLPAPEQVEEILANRVEDGDAGEWVFLLDYEEQKIDWPATALEQLTDTGALTANEQIENYIKQTLAMNEGREDFVDDKKALEDLQVVPQAGDYYFFIEENDGKDVLIVVAKPVDNKMYMLEWHH